MGNIVVSHIFLPPIPYRLYCASPTQLLLSEKKEVQNIVGAKSKHALYDIDREVVLHKSEIKYIREPSTMTPKEKSASRKCECGRTRIFPINTDECLSCSRTGV